MTIQFAFCIRLKKCQKLVYVYKYRHTSYNQPNMSNCLPFEDVDRGRETQLEVGEKLNKIS